MKIILASKSGVRKDILDKYRIDNEVVVSNVDEDEIKESLLSVQRRKDGGASCAWSLLMNFEKVHSWSEIMKKTSHVHVNERYRNIM